VWEGRVAVRAAGQAGAARVEVGLGEEATVEGVRVGVAEAVERVEGGREHRSVIQVSPAGKMDSLYAPRLQCLW